MNDIKVKFEDGNALCSTACPRLTIANGHALSACATTAQHGGYCGPWYRERVAELEAEVARLRAESAGHREPMVGDRVIVAHWSDFDPDDAVEIGTLSGVDGGYFYIFGSRRAWRYCKFVAALAGEEKE